jgi:nanoRNase/pAp phosphatase (c-di-AMP/oligoRNAs hydrolase)
MMALIDYCKHHTIEEILNLPDVRERVDLYMEHREQQIEQIRRCSTLHGRLVVLDLRNEETIYCGNRFMIYALFPESNISMHVLWGRQKQNTVFTVGKSILNRTNSLNIGDLMLEYAGGGHANAGTCQIANEDAARIQAELIERISCQDLAAV